VSALGARVEQLPELVPGGEIAGEIAGDLAARGLPEALRGVQMFGGSIDAFCEQLVAGIVNDGDVLVIIGATLITWAVIPEWHEADGLWTVPHNVEGKSLIGGPSNAGGIAERFAQEFLTSPTDPTASNARQDSIPVFIPFVRGERVPLHDPARTAQFLGLSQSTGPAGAWRAVYEASGFTVRRALELAGLIAGPSLSPEASATLPTNDERSARRIVVTGGGANNESWVQAIADVTGLPVDRVAEPMGAALGAALQARGEGAGDWSAIDRRFEPRPDWFAGCTERYETFVAASGPPFKHVGQD